MLPPEGAVASGGYSVHTLTNVTSPGDVFSVSRDLRPTVGGRGRIVGVECWLTLKDASIYMAVSEKTIRRMVQSGKLPDRRVGRQLRFKRQDLDQAMEAGLANKVGTEDTADFINHNISTRGTP